MSCSVSRKATTESLRVQEVQGFKEARDSLREEISQNLNENLSEHEMVTWTIIHRNPSDSTAMPDTVKVERITERTRLSGSELRVKNEKVSVEVVRDTIYIERKDSVEVQEFKAQGSSGSSSINAQHSTF